MAPSGEMVRHSNKDTPPVKRNRRLDERGSVPVELLVFIPVISVLVGFGLFWSGSGDRTESLYVAKNIAEIRASNPWQRAQMLETRFVENISAETSGCSVTPSAAEWYRQAEQTSGVLAPGAPVTVIASCGGGASRWVNVASPLAELTVASPQQGISQVVDEGCGIWLC